jgi:uncharacterized protein (DUF2141 family)
MAIQKISSTVIGSGAVTSEQIATGAITAADIPDGEITTAKLANDAVTNAKIADVAVASAQLADNLEFSGSYVKIPLGTTAERPVSPAPGMLRFNTEKGVLEQYISDNVWASIAPSAVVTSVVLPGSQTAVFTGDTITVNGVGFDAGAVVSYIDSSNNGTAAPTTTRINSTQLTATIPSLSEGTYDVVVTNGTGVTATLSNAFDVDGVAAFNTASGSLGSLLDFEESANFDVGATEDGSVVNVSITTGALPNGLSINSTGSITGTPSTSVSSDTAYSFTVTATDSENQTSTRSFSITILENYQPSGASAFGN